jgi:hypothetical protein
MPRKGYKQTAEHSLAIRKSLAGKVRPLVDVVVRFERKFEKTDGCWLWTGHLNRGGYGEIRIKGRAVSAHRFAWQLVHGPIPIGMLVMHRCDNPTCVRPDHLALGTDADNMRDRDAKGRGKVWPKGKRHTPEAREKMRASKRAKKISFTPI